MDASPKSASPPAEASPMMAQYLAIKRAHPDCLLFYRMGDFYELFFEDAHVAAAALDIVLTHRGQHQGADIPMCGVPMHAANAYLARLIRAGHRVAICEQTEDPAEAKRRGGKSVVARAVVRLVTPGTLVEDGLLDARRHNFLVAAARSGEAVGLAWCDISTGRLAASVLPSASLASELARLEPAELLLDPRLPRAAEPAPWPLTERDPAAFDSEAGRLLLNALFGSDGGLERPALAALAALVGYLRETQCGALPRLAPPWEEGPRMGGVMAIDAATRASLELSRTLGGERKGALLDTIDLTQTGGGARLLALDLSGPLTEAQAINDRLDLVSWFYADTATRTRLRLALKSLPDLERALSRLALDRFAPRDLVAIRTGLGTARTIKATLADAAKARLAPCTLLDAELARIGRHAALIDLLASALAAEPPAQASDGGVIADGHDPALDELRALARDGRQSIAGLEARYRARTGVNTLKIRHNGQIGYHIEAPARQADTLMRPDSGFIHRQTMVNAVRFATVELADLERQLSEAGGQALALEARHIAELRAAILAEADAISCTAAALARLDVASALAELAAREGWSRPRVDESLAFEVDDGRHPVVESALRAQNRPFVANGCQLPREGRVWLITGPNMAGKSTFLRQNALIAVLAQMGSFTPARGAHVGVLDRLFSRVGASDNLAQGRSTFMVEMIETAAILTEASERSLVILDEVGRGTATYDGLAIAWAVLEHIHDRLKARCLFATHYHELTALADRLDSLRLATVTVREWKGDLVFLHRIAPGKADRSYGLAVARLAGVPADVLRRADTILKKLEASGLRQAAPALLADLPLFAAAPQPEPPPDPLRQELADCRPDELTPRAALDLLYRLKALAGTDAKAQ